MRVPGFEIDFPPPADVAPVGADSPGSGRPGRLLPPGGEKSQLVFFEGGGQSASPDHAKRLGAANPSGVLHLSGPSDPPGGHDSPGGTRRPRRSSSRHLDHEQPDGPRARGDDEPVGVGFQDLARPPLAFDGRCLVDDQADRRHFGGRVAAMPEGGRGRPRLHGADAVVDREAGRRPVDLAVLLAELRGPGDLRLLLGEDDPRPATRSAIARATSGAPSRARRSSSSPAVSSGRSASWRRRASRPRRSAVSCGSP